MGPDDPGFGEWCSRHQDEMQDHDCEEMDAMSSENEHGLMGKIKGLDREPTVGEWGLCGPRDQDGDQDGERSGAVPDRDPAHDSPEGPMPIRVPATRADLQAMIDATALDLPADLLSEGIGTLLERRGAELSDSDREALERTGEILDGWASE